MKPSHGTGPAALSRRALLRAAGSAMVVGACGDASPTPVDDGRPQRILFITGDDLGWKDLSSSGNPNLHTPHLDRLRRGGVSFRRAFDVTSTCSSSRTTYATGQYPHTHGVTGLVHRAPSRAPISPGCRAISMPSPRLSDGARAVFPRSSTSSTSPPTKR